MIIYFGDRRKENALINNNNFCGYFLGYSEFKSSRSNTISKFARIEKDNSVKLFLINHETKGGGNLILNKKVCLTYYDPLYFESIAININ